MRCSRKSTTCRSSAWLAAIIVCAAALLGALAGVAAAQADTAGGSMDATVRRAITAAVRSRIGSDADVALSGLSFQTTAAVSDLVADPEPGARIGRRVRFTLQSADAGTAIQPYRQVGTASVTILVVAPHVEAARAIPRGTVLQAADLQLSQSAIDDLPLAALPIEQDLTGARAVRDLRSGEVLTSALVAIPPLVRTGDSVIVHVRFPGGEVMGRATASQNGTRGELIRLVNPSSGHALQGRVVGPDEVEVVR
jgi:flagella basal body P-ring formation protein FlgA